MLFSGAFADARFNDANAVTPRASRVAAQPGSSRSAAMQRRSAVLLPGNQ